MTDAVACCGRLVNGECCGRFVLAGTKRPAGGNPSAKGAGIDPNDPQPGFYKRRLVKDGPMVPVRIRLVDGERDIDPETGEGTGELISDQSYVADVWDGSPGQPVERDAWDQWTWVCGNPISKAEYESMVATAKWAQGTTAAEGNPNEAVDLRRTPPVF